jgi:hypothetical protein
MSEFGHTARQNGNVDGSWAEKCATVRFFGGRDGVGDAKLNERRDFPVETNFRSVFEKVSE